MKYYSNELNHYGTKRHSGRYPFGSGEEPYQSLSDDELKRLIVRKNLENRYNELNSNTGDFLRKKQSIDVAANSLKTASNIADVVSKGAELGSKKDLKTLADENKKFFNTSSDVVSKMKNKIKSNVNLEEMTDEDLKKIVDRMSLEAAYKNLYGSTFEKNGREKTLETLNTIGKITSVAGTALGIALTIKKLREKS